MPETNSLNWHISDILSVLAIVFSVFFSVLTLILNKKEKPSIMPSGHNLIDGNHFVLDFNNPSDVNLHELTILINGYNATLDEIVDFHLLDKFLFPISAKSIFHYGFNLGAEAKNNFYFRVRFKGKYFSRFPICPTRKFEQTIWYSCIVRYIDAEKISIKISTTHKDEIDKLEAKHKESLAMYEGNIDRKFKVK